MRIIVVTALGVLLAGASVQAEEQGPASPAPAVKTAEAPAADSAGTMVPAKRTASVAVRAAPDAPLKPVERPTVTEGKRPYTQKPEIAMPFYVLNNRLLPPIVNFALSGFMGDSADLRISGGYAAMLRDGYPSLRVAYSPAGSMGWCGAVWQNPANNWGAFDGGYNLHKARTLDFWARGEKGGEIVSFTVGGTAANYPDSDSLSTGEIQLSDQWMEYVVDLTAVDLRYISAGFGFVVKRDQNPAGCTFFLDDVRYE